MCAKVAQKHETKEERVNNPSKFLLSRLFYVPLFPSNQRAMEKAGGHRLNMRLSYGKGEIHIGLQGVSNGCAGSFNRVHRDYHGRDKVVWRA